MLNNLSKSQVFVAHSFWVIYRTVSRPFVELCMETPHWCTEYGRLKLTKIYGVHVFHKSSSILAHKHFLKWLYCWKSRGETFFQRDSVPIWVSRIVKTRNFKLLYFRNETSYGNGNLYRGLLFVYLQPSVNKNSYNLAILTLKFDDVTVKTIYSLHLVAIVNSLLVRIWLT